MVKFYMKTFKDQDLFEVWGMINCLLVVTALDVRICPLSTRFLPANMVAFDIIVFLKDAQCQVIQ